MRLVRAASRLRLRAQSGNACKSVMHCVACIDSNLIGILAGARMHCDGNKRMHAPMRVIEGAKRFDLGLGNQLIEWLVDRHGFIRTYLPGPISGK